MRRRAIVLAAVGAAVVVAIAVAYPLSHGDSSASAAVGATQGSSSAPSASSASSASSAVSTSDAWPPVTSAGTSSSSAVPHKSGYIANVADGDVIGVFGTSAGAPLYHDGAQLTVEPQAGRSGQTFQATALTSNGQPVYEFGDGLDINQLLDGRGGKVSLAHCACGSPTQMWWLSQDSSTPSGAPEQGAAVVSAVRSGPVAPQRS